MEVWRNVYNQISREIAAGEYRAGEKFLTIEELAAKYGVGRSTSYKVFKKLQADGLIVTNPANRNSGTIVRKANATILTSIEEKIENQFLALVSECFQLGKTEYDMTMMLQEAIQTYLEQN